MGRYPASVPPRDPKRSSTGSEVSLDISPGKEIWIRRPKIILLALKPDGKLLQVLRGTGLRNHLFSPLQRALTPANKEWGSRRADSPSPPLGLPQKMPR